MTVFDRDDSGVLGNTNGLKRGSSNNDGSCDGGSSSGGGGHNVGGQTDCGTLRSALSRGPADTIFSDSDVRGTARKNRWGKESQ